MKKIFSMMLLVASLLTISCDKDDNNDSTPVAVNYTGVMSITMTCYGQSLSTNQSDITYILEEGDDSASVTLSQVTFTAGLAEALPYVFEEDPYMPALDIVLPNIPMTVAGLYEADSVTPTTLYGYAFDTDTIKSITNVKVTTTDEMLLVTFNCSLSLSFGEVEATISFVSEK